MPTGGAQSWLLQICGLRSRSLGARNPGRLEPRLPLELVPKRDLSAVRAALSAGYLNMVVDSSGTILVEDPISVTDTSTGSRYVRAVATALGTQQAFAQAGLTPGQAAAVAKAKPWPVESVHPSNEICARHGYELLSDFAALP
jgi:hypothetical protein